MEILLDSNILIYSASPTSQKLQVFLSENTLFVSEITVLEVLGYHKLTYSDKIYFDRFFMYCNRIPISADIIQKAISLRQLKAMSLGDSIIAGTAIVHQFPLLTLNIKDFKHIQNLVLIDSMD